MVNSVDPDEAAHNEPPHQDLHCLQKTLFPHSMIWLFSFPYKWWKTTESPLKRESEQPCIPFSGAAIMLTVCNHFISY